MERPVRKFYDDQLKTLEGMHAKLGFGTAAMLERAYQALKTNNHVEAQSVIDSDIEINHLEKEIERYVMRIIARQQPIGTDLRMILSVFASSSDLERVADHATSIAKGILQIDNLAPFDPIMDDLFAVGELAKNMLGQAIDAFSQHNVERAKEIADIDDEVDSAFRELVDQALVIMEKQPETVKTGSAIIAILHDIERIADYATNLCERVIYTEDANIVNLND
ncbi:phosphate signaling complex protein PhoU [Aerococcus urinaeequi]|uniref:Phosphate-specific transport system accessory protein PhoU n=1 Tax=Aerococcus viridans TaxID=1377 RepID=A0A2N6UE71_9LACT|nr:MULTISPECIES: phosphate signaling complex protein PhoU [Aerococcus]OFU49831.1 transcriptional regulator [Aerococcus sp. HMSC10H05]PMC79903.1 phosphate transport system regulatory protein PhoU [Aerococcus viridans]